MKFTENYKLGSIEVDQILDPLEDSRRFLTIDRQLLGLFQVFGNGIVTGWDLSKGSGLVVIVAPGRGHVNFMSAETNDPRSVVDLAPNTTNYVYALAVDSTRYDRNVLFFSDTVLIPDGRQVLLGSVTTSGGAVIQIDTSIRNDISFIETIKDLINSHRHRGGTSNPTKIDLTSEVTGTLPGFMIDGIDASKITSGKVPVGRIPKLKHSDLADSGVLTHAQLDSYVRDLSNPNSRLIGEISTINAMQLYLANKHIWNEVDAHSSNALFLIPGISADSMIDFVNTTAVIDKANHTIQGIPSVSGRLLTTTFSTTLDFLSANLQSNILIGEDGNGAYFKITRPTSELIVESFDNVFADGTTFAGWKLETVAASTGTSFASDSTEKTDGAYSAKFNIDQSIRVQCTKTFDSVVDWSSYSEFEIWIETKSTEHGQIRCQILNDKGIAIDDFALLGVNETTVGFRKVIRDITSLTLTKVLGVRLYTDTALGWDLAAFAFNVDQIKVNNTLFYNASGRARFRLKTPQKSQWAAISWTNDSGVEGQVLVRARTAPTYETFDRSSSSPFSAFISVSGSDPKVIDNRVIEIEVQLLPNASKTSSPVFRSLTVSYITAAEETGISIDTATDFLRGTQLLNSKVEDSGDVIINGRIDVGDVVYGQLTSLQQTSLLNSAVKQYGTPIVGITGSLLPLSPMQAVSATKVPSVSLVASVTRLQDRTYLVADTGNDRIVLFDRNGAALRILCSNNVVSETDLYPLCASYNPANKTLYIAWSKPLISNGVDLTQALIQGPGLSVPLSNVNDSLVKITGVASDIQTGNSTAIVLSTAHASAIHDFIASGTDSRIYLSVTAAFAQEKVAVTNENFAKLTTVRGIPIFIGDVKYIAGIFRPICVSITAAGNYLIGNAKPPATTGSTITTQVTSAIEMVPQTGQILYSDNSVDFSQQYLGNVIEQDGKYFVLAGSVLDKNSKLVGTVNTIDKASGRIVSQYNTSDGTVASDVQLDANENLVIIERSATTSDSRVITVDDEANVIFQYELNSGRTAQDVRVLSTGNLVVSA